MNRKMRFWKFFVFALITVLMLNCAKDDTAINVNEIPKLTTKLATYITGKSAVSGGEIVSIGVNSISESGICWSLHENPSITDNKIKNDSTKNSFTNALSGLTSNTTYYVRAYAINSAGVGYGNQVIFKTKEVFTFIDSRDGAVYEYVTIGNQVWMAQDLRYLQQVNTRFDISFTEPKYYMLWYNGTDITEAKNFGTNVVYYNWMAAINNDTTNVSKNAQVQGACPNGWHLPNELEFKELIDFVGGSKVGGKHLKDTVGWGGLCDQNTNEYGFSASANGKLIAKDQEFGWFGAVAFWASTDATDDSGVGMGLSYQSDVVYIGTLYKREGHTIRCIKD